ncbi:uncharacterized protein [Chiloscyllium punctatum]|uniref:uncharacterized protein isoform X4 n=1 Tax=Chiloscyllium punctatum TaxID=137246 RepID=UPI003B632945
MPDKDNLFNSGNDEAGHSSDDICRDFLRNVCKRGTTTIEFLKEGGENWELHRNEVANPPGLPWSLQELKIDFPRHCQPMRKISETLKKSSWNLRNFSTEGSHLVHQSPVWCHLQIVKLYFWCLCPNHSMKIVNSGPSTDPCGTSLFIICQWELVLVIQAEQQNPTNQSLAETVDFNQRV